MKKYTTIMICIFMLLCLVGCQSQKTMTEMISEEIGIGIESGEEIINYSSEETFHGDGEVFYGFQFSSNDLENKIKNDDLWKQLPVSSTLEEILKKSNFESFSVPEISNGYYFFLDRHSEAIDYYDEEKVLERNSMNYTLAIYDVDTQILYYIRYNS